MDIYKNYKRAMDKRRPDSALEEERFWTYINRDDVVYRQKGDSYLFGVMELGVFVPTHFAPNGLKESIELIKEQRKERTVFVVTPDLGDMLKKLGFHKLCKTKAEFRGVLVEKVVYTGSYLNLLIMSSHKIIQCAISIYSFFNSLKHRLKFKWRKGRIDEDVFYSDEDYSSWEG